ncbi:MAG: hypothetical protein LBU57_08295 [Dysgonamonadaceae bacterium]|jgi:hypothetical protein|nr:hypothetical protein [Dysgonamonadaceae bacterium]
MDSMKKIFLFIIVNFSCNLYGQDDGFVKNYEPINILCYADSIPIISSLGIDLENNVASFKSDLKKVIVDKKEYDGKFYFKLKQKANLISLKQICEKYIKEEIYTPIYLINGKFLKDDISAIKIDDNFILRVNHINSDNFDGFDQKTSPKFTFILIFTKTKENLKRASEIRIR